MLDREWLLGVARHERDAFGRTVQYTDPSYWEADSPVDSWRLKDVTAHLAASDVAAAAILGGEESAEGEEYRKTLDGRPIDTDGWNDWSVARRLDESHLSLAMEWGRAADLFLARASEISEEEWGQKMVRWLVGEMKAAYLIQYRVSEWWAHGEDVREGGGLAPRLEHYPIYCVSDFAVRLIPYALGLEGERYPERSVEIELEGVGEGRWRQGLAAGCTPPEDAKPDAFISGRGYAFASVAAGRADPDVCLYEGLLLTGGDVALAEAVLRTLRSYP
jgi:uncharacterized protein (TIGR03083 family)